jgi:hypothetical protein
MDWLRIVGSTRPLFSFAMTAKIPVSKTKPRKTAETTQVVVDRRVSVAPMMDWTDAVSRTNKIINLGMEKMA